uniref:Uncharacterized protein n=1 Tax=Arundo donax TaxID=35708 RepID=A0A0A8YQP7_ARUDO
MNLRAQATRGNLKKYN